MMKGGPLFWKSKKLYAIQNDFKKERPTSCLYISPNVLTFSINMTSLKILLSTFRPFQYIILKIVKIHRHSIQYDKYKNGARVKLLTQTKGERN